MQNTLIHDNISLANFVNEYFTNNPCKKNSLKLELGNKSEINHQLLMTILVYACKKLFNNNFVNKITDEQYLLLKANYESFGYTINYTKDTEKCYIWFEQV